MNEHVPEQELAERRQRLGEQMREHGIDAMFVPPSSRPRVPDRHASATCRASASTATRTAGSPARSSCPDEEPLFVLPRMFVAFHLWGVEPPRCITVNESDDGSALFAKAAQSLGPIARLGVGARTWGETMIEIGHALPGADVVNGTPLVNRLRRVKSPLELELMTAACKIADETMAAVAPLVQPGVTMAELAEQVEHELRLRGSRTPSFPTHLFSYGYPESHDSQTPSGLEPIREGEAVMFDFGAVHASGYSSDFGRTSICGEPPKEYLETYAVLIAAQEAGRAAAGPACLQRGQRRLPRPDRGGRPRPVLPPPHGPRHRARTCTRSRTSPSRTTTPLEPGMTFTDEPSILWDDHFAVRMRERRGLRRGRRARAQRVPERRDHQHHQEGLSVPAASRDELPEREIAPGYSARYEDWGGMTVSFESAPAGTDPGPMVKGLQGRPLPGASLGLPVHGARDRRLRRPHRGDPRRAGLPRAARPPLSFVEDSDALEFSRTDELEQTFEAVRRNAAAGSTEGG